MPMLHDTTSRYQVVVCKNTLFHGLAIDEPDSGFPAVVHLSDCEKSEMADEEFEKFARMIETMSSPSAEDFEKLRSLFQKASKLAFAAGIEHQKANHVCLSEIRF